MSSYYNRNTSATSSTNDKYERTEKLGEGT